MAQQLPRHLRRRAVSHNPKRLPRRFHEKHKREREKSNGNSTTCKPKRPSRKYRRKPKNLLDAYNRRQRDFVWLETHIWHAKRFHMVKKWGYQVAEYPRDKNFRACFRAGRDRCLMQVCGNLSVKQSLSICGKTRSLYFTGHFILRVYRAHRERGEYPTVTVYLH